MHLRISESFHKRIKIEEKDFPIEACLYSSFLIFTVYYENWQ